MNTLRECQICDVLGTDKDELCAPRPVDSRRGSDVSLEIKISHMCNPVRSRVHYRCEQCNRPSASSYFICRARPLEL